jgi:hypothetical protein
MITRSPEAFELKDRSRRKSRSRKDYAVKPHSARWCIWRTGQLIAFPSDPESFVQTLAGS